MKVRAATAAVVAASLFVVLPARADFYDLERAVGEAMDVSTNVGISREQLAFARSDVLRSYSNWLPNLFVRASTGHSFTGPTTSGFVDSQGRIVQGPATDFENYGFSINSSMTIFNWGASINRVNEAKRSADAASYDLEYQKDFTKALVIREFYDLVKQRKLHEVQADDVEAQRRNLEQVEAFYRIGSRTKADFLQARVNLANSELELLNAQNAAVIADARLKSRLNLPQLSQLDVDESLAIHLLDVDIEAEVQYMFDHRSDLLAGRQRVEASKAALSSAKKGWLPTVDGNFAYSWSDRAGPSDGEVFKSDYVWSVGVAVNWPIFDRFETKVNTDQARVGHRIAEYNLQQAKIDAILDFKQIVLNLDQARQRLDLSGETVGQAEENLRLAEERYRVGAGTLLETFQATASLTRAQAQLIEAQVDYLVNRADLRRATGRPIVTK